MEYDMDPEEAYSMMEAYGMGGGPDPQEKLVDTDFFNSKSPFISMCLLVLTSSSMQNLMMISMTKIFSEEHKGWHF